MDSLRRYKRPFKVCLICNVPLLHFMEMFIELIKIHCICFYYQGANKKPQFTPKCGKFDFDFFFFFDKINFQVSVVSTNVR